jgi:hypothetical protein
MCRITWAPRRISDRRAVILRSERVGSLPSVGIGSSQQSFLTLLRNETGPTEFGRNSRL